MGEDALELEASGEAFEPSPDARPRMPEPLPVRLVAIDDVRLPAAAGVEAQLDAFYVDLLRFEREGAENSKPRPIEPLLGRDRAGATPPPLVLGLLNRETLHGPGIRAHPSHVGDHGPDLVYRADNFRLLFHVVEPPVSRDGLRVQWIEVPSLAEAEARLIDAELDYTRQRGLVPGQESLLLRDPAGNWLELVEMTAV